MKVMRNGNVMSVSQFTFSNGWNVSVVVEFRPDADVMIWNSKGETIRFPKHKSPHPDSELYNVSDDKLAQVLACVQKLSPNASLESVRQVFN